MTHQRQLPAVALAAACGPSLLAYNASPSPTFLNQALALALWGWFVAVAALVTQTAQPVRRFSLGAVAARPTAPRLSRSSCQVRAAADRTQVRQ